MTRHAFALAITLLYPLASLAEDQNPNEAIAEAIQSQMDFTEYSGGVVLPAQILDGAWKDYFIVDTRSAERFGEGHLPDAVHIEWRELPGRREELPRDRPVLLYCDTGMLSAQDHFAVRLLGWDNSRVLQGGYSAWTQQGGPTTTPANP